MSSILHGENSTAKTEWYPNPVTRGAWNIYQTCIVGKREIRCDYSILLLIIW